MARFHWARKMQNRNAENRNAEIRNLVPPEKTCSYVGLVCWLLATQSLDCRASKSRLPRKPCGAKGAAEPFFPYSEEDKRATTNVQHRFVQFFLLYFLLFCSPGAKTPCFEGKSPGGKILKRCEKVRKIMKRFCPLVVAL